VIMADNATPIYWYLLYARICDVKGVQGKYNHSTITFTLKEFF
jgi:hypothetical protein